MQDCIALRVAQSLRETELSNSGSRMHSVNFHHMLQRDAQSWQQGYNMHELHLTSKCKPTVTAEQVSTMLMTILDSCNIPRCYGQAAWYKHCASGTLRAILYQDSHGAATECMHGRNSMLLLLLLSSVVLSPAQGVAVHHFAL